MLSRFSHFARIVCFALTAGLFGSILQGCSSQGKFNALERGSGKVAAADFSLKGGGDFHTAVENKDVKGVETLLNRGEDPNKFDEQDRTPLFIAVVRGYQNIAEILLKGGAKLNIGSRINKTLSPTYPLIGAIANKNVEMLQLLLDVGRPDLDLSSPEHSENGYLKFAIYMFAKKKRSPRMVSLLINRGIDLGIDLENENSSFDVLRNLTPLGVALNEAINFENEPNISQRTKDNMNDILYRLIDKGARLEPALCYVIKKLKQSIDGNEKRIGLKKIIEVYELAKRLNYSTNSLEELANDITNTNRELIYTTRGPINWSYIAKDATTPLIGSLYSLLRNLANSEPNEDARIRFMQETLKALEIPLQTLKDANIAYEYWPEESKESSL
jgi:hypothetical protein